MKMYIRQLSKSEYYSTRQCKLHFLKYCYKYYLICNALKNTVVKFQIHLQQPHFCDKKHEEAKAKASVR